MFFIFLAKNQSFETVAKRVPCTADEITDDDIWSPTPNGVNVDLNTVIIRDSMSPNGHGNIERKIIQQNSINHHPTRISNSTTPKMKTVIVETLREYTL